MQAAGELYLIIQGDCVQSGVRLSQQYLYCASQVRELDRIAIEDLEISGLTLMRRAAAACVKQITTHYAEFKTVTVFCGSGNNAGDGYIVAGLLAGKGREVQVIVVGDQRKLKGDAAAAHEFCAASSAILDAANGEIRGDLIVDALLGTGLSGAVRKQYARVIQLINDAHKPVIAVDIPSGLCADTGSVLGCAVEADMTITFIGRKRGLYTNEGPDCAGEVIFDSLGVPEHVCDKQTKNAVEILSTSKMIKRRKNSHKSSHGHVLVIGGDYGMGGAVMMSAEVALRTGAGLVSVATRPENTAPLQARCPEIMAAGVNGRDQLEPMLARATSLVVGPGLGQCEWSIALFEMALDSALPMVVDADGLSLLAKGDEFRNQWVLTPHPGEARRLLGRVSTKDDAGPGGKDQLANVQQDRFAAIKILQEEYGGTVLLKGVGTLVTDGQFTSLCPFGNPGMATAGMGDVLSGVIGGLLAQGQTCYEAATKGAVLHAMAGDIAAEKEGERGLIATDLIPIIRRLANA